MDIFGKKIVILGLGNSGASAAILATEHGAVVTVLDIANTAKQQELASKLEKKNVKVFLGVTKTERFQGCADLFVMSPGVPTKSLLGQLAVTSGKTVYSELSFAWQFVSSRPTVAITGTNGKTTTTELCTSLLSASGYKVKSCGNIGYAVSDLALEKDEYDYNVFEVSSFHLDFPVSFAPHVAILTNITPDHLERYDSMEDYEAAKLNIFRNQTENDWAIIEWNTFHELKSKGFIAKSKILTYSSSDTDADLYVKDGSICSKGIYGIDSKKILDISKLKLQGNHNIENVMAAILSVLVIGGSVEKAANAACQFLPSKNRCEKVAQIAGIWYINDSKATNVDATARALEMLAENKNVWLIAGGKDKGFNFDSLRSLIRKTVKRAILIGETRDHIHKDWDGCVEMVFADSMKEAVDYAAANAVSGDIVLLSPACSSFDMFKSYVHRGEVFRECVENLKI